MTEYCLGLRQVDLSNEWGLASSKGCQTKAVVPVIKNPVKIK